MEGLKWFVKEVEGNTKGVRGINYERQGGVRKKKKKELMEVLPSQRFLNVMFEFLFSSRSDDFLLPSFFTSLSSSFSILFSYSHM